MKNLNPNQEKALKAIQSVVAQWETGENPPTCNCYNEKLVDLTKHLRKDLTKQDVDLIQYHLSELLDVLRTIK